MTISPRNDAPGAMPAEGAFRLTSALLRGERRARVVAALRRRELREVARSDLLAPARLPTLARDSLTLLVAGGAFFAIINIIAWDLRHVTALPGPDIFLARLLLLVVANLIAYAVMLPIHEALHAVAILLLGGRPRFGLRLPLAAYCTAPGQVFTRQGYIFVALAPLVGLTVLGIVVTILWPQWATWLWFGFAGNISGAVGDLATVSEMRQLPRDVLVADNEAGYTAYAVGDGD